MALKKLVVYYSCSSLLDLARLRPKLTFSVPSHVGLMVAAVVLLLLQLATCMAVRLLALHLGAATIPSHHSTRISVLV